jgi:hypothetical protein
VGTWSSGLVLEIFLVSKVRCGVRVGHVKDIGLLWRAMLEYRGLMGWDVDMDTICALRDMVG